MRKHCRLARAGTVTATILGLAAAAAASVAAQAPGTAERRDRVENGLLTPVVVAGERAGMAIGDRMRHYGVPGVSVAVIHDGDIDWAAGYGVADAAGRTRVDSATLFQAASISKPVAAIGVLRLVEQGRLELDTDVNRWLRSWRVPGNGFTLQQPVTLRRLLSHTAGLTVHGFRGYAPGDAVPTIVQVLDGAPPANSAAVRADTTPGALWRYSGGGSSVAQLLAQEVTGRGFAELMRDLVLRPAGMDRSGFEQPLPARSVRSAAAGHRAGGQPVAGRWHTYPEMFAAGLWTTPADLARLAIAVQRSLAGAGHLLSADMARQMLTDQAGGYGLGFAVSSGDGWAAFHHGGANEGFRAQLFAFSHRGQGAVVMTNSDAGGPLATEILRAIAHEYDWPTFRAAVRDVVPAHPARLADLAGEYTFQSGAGGAVQTLAITAAGTTLRSSGRPLGERTLYHAGDDRFFSVESTAELRFLRGPDGIVTGAVLEGAGPPFSMARRR
jgi:CubicO group peptidase (beta-lactamase class C family)